MIDIPFFFKLEHWYICICYEKSGSLGGEPCFRLEGQIFEGVLERLRVEGMTDHEDALATLAGFRGDIWITIKHFIIIRFFLKTVQNKCDN